MPPIPPCGCVRYPAFDRHRCYGQLSERMVAAGAQAARHLIELGLPPLLGDVELLRRLWARGGPSRALAQEALRAVRR